MSTSTPRCRSIAATFEVILRDLNRSIAVLSQLEQAARHATAEECP